MKIESHDTSIESLLSAYFLVIPRFQRPYSWDDENIEEFWKDVCQNEEKDYFIGSMVVYKNGRQQLGVVDGQQRLTTITILLCAIRDKMIEAGDKTLAEGLHNSIERPNHDNVRGYVLKTETSFPYLQEEIQRLDSPEIRKVPGPEELRLQAAYDFFLRQIALDLRQNAGDDQQSKITRLKYLRDRVLLLSLIRIELDNEDDAYAIFETLNTRGKDLALTDLLKNHFSKLIKAKGDVDFVKIKWSEVLTTLQDSPISVDPDLFLVHSWASRYTATTQQKAFKAIKAEITKDNAKLHLSNLVKDSTYYRSIFDPNPFWGKDAIDVRSSLHALNLFRVTQPTPGVLSLVRSYRESKIKLPALRRALAAIEDFHFLFTAVTSSRSSGGISAMYSSFGRRLHECSDSNEAGIEINALIEKLVERRPPLDEFLAGWMQVGYSTKLSKQSGLVRYILTKLSMHAGLAFSEDFDLLTVEHIHPQSSDSAPWSPALVAQLGNLMFLTKSQNGDLSDESFVKKLPFYKNWPQSVPEAVRSKLEWLPDDAEGRGRDLGTTAYQHVWTVKH
jgi:hypothetical protein